MKRINQEQDIVASFSRLRSPIFGARLACEADFSAGVIIEPQASSGRTSASSVESLFSSSALFNRSDVIQNPVFCGLSLELFARPVMNYKTVLPKAAVTAGKMILGLNLGVASAALRDARQRYLWKGEW
jgi:hypothetical protein